MSDLHEIMEERLFKAGLEYPLPKPFDLQAYYRLGGVVRREDLRDGVWYAGLCRNASLAVWDAEKGVFWYLRWKWHGPPFAESIHHLADDDGYDLFVPMAVVDERVFVPVV